MIVCHAYGPPLVGEYCRRVCQQTTAVLAFVGNTQQFQHNSFNKKGTLEHNTQNKKRETNVPILASPAFAAWMVHVLLPSPSAVVLLPSVVCPAVPRVTKQTATVAPEDVTPRDFE